VLLRETGKGDFGWEKVQDFSCSPSSRAEKPLEKGVTEERHRLFDQKSQEREKGKEKKRD